MLISPRQFIKIIIAAILSFGIFLTTSCFNDPTGNANANSNNTNRNANGANANSVKDDLVELSTVVKLPEQPDEVVWRETENTAGGKKLVAVLKYKPEDASKIAAAAEKIKPAEAVEIGAEDWFPEELIAQSQVSGSESLKAKAYSANDFLNPPYKNGRLARINETDYFVLEVTTY